MVDSVMAGKTIFDPTRFGEAPPIGMKSCWRRRGERVRAPSEPRRLLPASNPELRRDQRHDPPASGSKAYGF